MKCPECGKPVQTVGRFTICPEHGSVTAIEDPKQEASDLCRSVLERYPFPVAHGYKRTIQPDNAATGIKNLLFTYTALLRFGTLVFLGQFLRSNVQQPKVAQAVRGLQMPHLSDWAKALFTFANNLFPFPHGNVNAPLPPLAEGGPLSAELVRSVHRFKKMRIGEQSPENMLLKFRNEFDGHGASWSEQECRKHLDHWTPVLEQVLEAFSSLARLTVYRRSGSGMIRLAGAQDTFEVQPIEDTRMDTLFEESEIVVSNAEGDSIPLFPLFVGPEGAPEGYHEELFAFDGHGKKTVVYLGVSRRNERQETLAQYMDLLVAKNIDPRFTKEDLRPWQVTEWARETTLGVIDNLTNVKYFPAFYQERRTQKGKPANENEAAGVDDAVESWLSRGRESALILSAEAGSGKTSLLCHVAEKLLQQDPDDAKGNTDCVVLLLGIRLRGSGKGRIFDGIRSILGFVEDPAKGGIAGFEELLNVWYVVGNSADAEHERRRLILSVDAVNEAEDPKGLLEEAAELAAAAATANRSAGRCWVRLMLSVRAERLEALLSHWKERQDTSFLSHPENFAHFRNEAGKEVPYLSMRRFSLEEAEGAYASARAALHPSSCPAGWNALSPATHVLLRHPLMLLLFHGAFAGTGMPSSISTEETLWSAWLDRVFSSKEGGQKIEDLALRLADECINRGESHVPAALAGEWRNRWQSEMGNDPVLIAAGIDDIERLAVASILRRVGESDWDWISDSLAENVFYRSLKRRAPVLNEEPLETWLKLPETNRLNGALVHACTATWNSGKPASLRLLMDWRKRGRRILGETLLQTAPRGKREEIGSSLSTFQERLQQLCDAVLATPTLEDDDLLKDCLIWEVGEVIASLSGSAGALRVILQAAHKLALRLVELEPENTTYQRGLSVTFSKMGDLYERSDPARARECYLKDLEIATRLVDLEPENTIYLRDLSVSFGNMGDLDERSDLVKAGDWYLKCLEIRKRLLDLEPENTTYLRDLSVTFSKMGKLDGRFNPDKSREWYLQVLEITKRLVELEPEDRNNLHNLSVSFSKMGKLDERSDAAKSRAWYLKGLEIAKRLVELEPERSTYLRCLAISFDEMGGLDERSDPAKARDWYVKSLEIAKRLVELEPENRNYLRSLSISYHRIGGLDERSDPARAREWYLKDLEIATRLVDLEPENADYLRGLSASFNGLGGLDARSDPAKAREWYLKCLAIAARLVALEPENTNYLHDLSVSYERMGDLDQGADPAKAREWYEKYLEIMKRLNQVEPENTYYLSALSLSYAKMGRVDEYFDRSKAREWYVKSLKIAERLTELEPENRSYKYDLFLSFDGIGRIDEGSDGPKAREFYVKNLEIAESLIQLQPENKQYQRALSIGYANLARLESDPAKARELYDKRLEITKKLAELEPENRMYLRELSVTYNEMGRVNERTDPAKACEWYRKCLEIRRRLVELEPQNNQFLRDLSLNYLQMSEADSKSKMHWFIQGASILGCLPNPNLKDKMLLFKCHKYIGSFYEKSNPLKAHSWYLKSLEITEGTDYFRSLGVSGFVLGDLARVSKRLAMPDAERDYSQRYLDAMRQAAKVHANSSSVQYNLACALSRTGSADAALEALSEAVRLGYCDVEEASEEQHLEPLCDHPRFKELFEEMRQKQAASRRSSVAY